MCFQFENYLRGSLGLQATPFEEGGTIIHRDYVINAFQHKEDATNFCQDVEGSRKRTVVNLAFESGMRCR